MGYLLKQEQFRRSTAEVTIRGQRSRDLGTVFIYTTNNKCIQTCQHVHIFKH